MYLIALLTWASVEEIQKKLQPPHHTLPGWYEEDAGGTDARLVTLHVRKEEEAQRLFPDAVIQSSDYSEGESFYCSDAKPLPKWFSTDGYKVEHVRTKADSKDGVNNRFFLVTPLNEIRI